MMSSPGTKKSALRFAFLLIAAIAPISAARAEVNYPSRYITWVVPTAPGAPSDITMRLLAEAMGQQLKGTIIIQNRPGAGGTIAANVVAKAPHDGYTLMASVGDPFISQIALQKDIPYDPEKDFVYITKLISSNAAMLAASSLPANNPRELVALAKATPNGLSYGSFGAGSFPQIIMETLARASGARFNAVNYRGSPQALQELVGGDIAVTFGAAAATRLIAEGKVKIIAQLGESRGLLKDVPTFLESGFTDDLLRIPLWTGLVGPRGIPEEIVQKIAAAAKHAVSQPNVRQFLIDNSYESIASTPDEFDRAFRREYSIVPARIRQMGIEPN